jgi:hypothetical protein
MFGSRSLPIWVESFGIGGSGVASLLQQRCNNVEQEKRVSSIAYHGHKILLTRACNGENLEGKWPESLVQVNSFYHGSMLIIQLHDLTFRPIKGKKI